MDEEKCAQCGTSASLGAKFCESCGAPMAAASQPVQGPTAAEPAPSYAAPSAQLQYQGVLIRFGALFIDGFLVGIISSILTAPFAASTFTYDASTNTFSVGPAIAVIIVIQLLYLTLFLGRYGQSIGMMMMRIKVVREADSGPITYGAAFIRTILLYIDAIPYLVPYLLGAILIWTSDKKQRLGDRVAHTVVVKK